MTLFQNRGASLYDADSLTNDFTFAELVSSTANTTLPDRSDSGIFFDWITFNLRDQIREKDNEPLQFKYIPANCRLYYKLSNVYNMPNLWHDVADAIWNDQSLCVPGSTGLGDTTIEPPPPTDITVTVPFVNFPNNSTDLAESASDEGGIQDGQLRAFGITRCTSQCAGQCHEISLHCGKAGSVVRKDSACLPNCKVNVDHCQADVSCVATGAKVQSESKFNGLGKKNPAITGQGSYIPGICKPSRIFTADPGTFGCPLG